MMEASHERGHCRLRVIGNSHLKVVDEPPDARGGFRFQGNIMDGSSIYDPYGSIYVV